MGKASLPSYTEVEVHLDDAPFPCRPAAQNLLAYLPKLQTRISVVRCTVVPSKSTPDRPKFAPGTLTAAISTPFQPPPVHHHAFQGCSHAFHARGAHQIHEKVCHRRPVFSPIIQYQYGRVHVPAPAVLRRTSAGPNQVYNHIAPCLGYTGKIVIIRGSAGEANWAAVPIQYFHPTPAVLLLIPPAHSLHPAYRHGTVCR